MLTAVDGMKIDDLIQESSTAVTVVNNNNNNEMDICDNQKPKVCQTKSLRPDEMKLSFYSYSISWKFCEPINSAR